ncbi:MAG: hypothetical protein OHK0056_06840 [Bacteriovoracaceae bacterium]
MKKIILSVVAMTMTFILIIAEASGKDIQFGNVLTRGTGCPMGTTSVIKTEDQQTLTVLFDEMRVELPQMGMDNDNDVVTDENPRARRKDDPYYSHKTCAINIEADVKEGEMIESVEVDVDFRGISFLDQGVQALFHSQFVEFKGPQAHSRRAKDMVARKVWRMGDAEEDWLIEANKTFEIKSQCSRLGDSKVSFALLNMVKAQIAPSYRNTGVTGLIALDSADLKASMKLKVNTRPCLGNGNGPVIVNPPNRPDRPNRPGRGDQICPRGYVFSPSFNRCIPSRR